MAMMLNKYFSVVFNTTLFNDNINTNYIDTNSTTSSASVVDSQEATTVLSNKSNGTAYIDNENPYVLEQQNCVRENLIISEHSLENFEITTEDILNVLTT